MKTENVNQGVALLAAGVSLLAIWLAARAQPFRRVEVDGHSVRVLPLGYGGPTVVFEAGAGGPLESWVRVQPEVSKFTSTFSYDRAGNGLSPRGPTPRDGREVAQELHAALQGAQAPPPYVLVGHSLGGPYIRVFAGLYPSEVAGMVLVDPTQEELVAWAKAREPQPAVERPLRPYDEVDCAPATFAQAHDSRVPAGAPVLLITGMGPRVVPSFLPENLKAEVQQDAKTFWPAKLKFHQQWVETIPRGQLVVTKNSGHGIPLEEPELVVSAIRQVVEQARSRP